jgi:hypothetical protein
MRVTQYVKELYPHPQLLSFKRGGRFLPDNFRDFVAPGAGFEARVHPRRRDGHALGLVGALEEERFVQVALAVNGVCVCQDFCVRLV